MAVSVTPPFQAIVCKIARLFDDLVFSLALPLLIVKEHKAFVPRPALSPDLVTPRQCASNKVPAGAASLRARPRLGQQRLPRLLWQLLRRPRAVSRGR